MTPLNEPRVTGVTGAGRGKKACGLTPIHQTQSQKVKMLNNKVLL